MMDIIIACIWIFTWELYWNIVWWWSLVTQAVLQNILHFDIKHAMALDNSSIIWASIWVMLILWKSNKIRWWFLIFIIFQTFWSWLWALFFVKVDPKVLQIVFLLSIVLIVLKNFFTKPKEHHEKWFKENLKSIFLLWLAALFIWSYNSAFVIWNWIVWILILTSLFWFHYKNAVFLLVFSAFFSKPIAIYEFYNSWLLDLNFFIPMAFSTFIAWIFAWTILEKVHYKKLELFLKYISLVLVWYLIYWMF